MTRPPNCWTQVPIVDGHVRAKMCMLSDRPHNVGLHIPRVDRPIQVRNDSQLLDLKSSQLVDVQVECICRVWLGMGKNINVDLTMVGPEVLTMDGSVRAKMCMCWDRPHNVGPHVPTMDGPTRVGNVWLELTIVGPQVPKWDGHVSIKLSMWSERPHNCWTPQWMDLQA